MLICLAFADLCLCNKYRLLWSDALCIRRLDSFFFVFLNSCAEMLSLQAVLRPWSRHFSSTVYLMLIKQAECCMGDEARNGELVVGQVCSSCFYFHACQDSLVFSALMSYQFVCMWTIATVVDWCVIFWVLNFTCTSLTWFSWCVCFWLSSVMGKS